MQEGRSAGLQITQADLDKELPYETGRFECVFALSVLEHLLMACRFLQEAVRVLEPGGKIVLLTPNISTYFTVALLLAGRMPSTGPYPDDARLVRQIGAGVSMNPDQEYDVDSNEAVLRHLVVFSYRMLGRYLRLTGLEDVRGRGFGVYPFPRFSQAVLERLGPYHAHQMVFTATKA